ncbi:hypothetical protein SAMN04488058_10521 [Deinococcus reticulitermitis]|uniref:Uncharacterized protein n=1 Tax=Deinococcus reticulitermitis TaxID=856736 RepID=A0A1H6XAW8_9DEIO|nr:hypothetical protein [Deinococcus reticulitermitis]SEJ22020.1 hypothetical protein SAMN04488058_10521 [Deinococcus reticulitermitis]
MTKTPQDDQNSAGQSGQTPAPNPADSTAVTEGQARAMNMEPERGARQEPGAQPSDELIGEQTDSTTTGNSKYTALDVGEGRSK